MEETSFQGKGVQRQHLQTDQDNGGCGVGDVEEGPPAGTLPVLVALVIEIALYHSVHHVFAGPVHVGARGGVGAVGKEIGTALYGGQHAVDSVGQGGVSVHKAVAVVAEEVGDGHAAEAPLIPENHVHQAAVFSGPLDAQKLQETMTALAFPSLTQISKG